MYGTVFANIHNIVNSLPDNIQIERLYHHVIDPFFNGAGDFLTPLNRCFN